MLSLDDCKWLASLGMTQGDNGMYWTEGYQVPSNRRLKSKVQYRIPSLTELSYFANTRFGIKTTVAFEDGNCVAYDWPEDAWNTATKAPDPESAVYALIAKLREER